MLKCFMSANKIIINKNKCLLIYGLNCALAWCPPKKTNKPTILCYILVQGITLFPDQQIIKISTIALYDKRDMKVVQDRF